MLGLISAAAGYLLVNGYFLCRFLTWMKNVHEYTRKKRIRVPGIALALFLASAPLVGFLMPKGTDIKAFFSRVGNFWFGICIYGGMILVVADLVRLTVILIEKVRREPTGLRTRRSHVIVGAVCIAVTMGIALGGSINAHIIRVDRYDLRIDKRAGERRELKIVLCADLHMGYSIRAGHIRQMVDKINAQEPDIVVFAGDIFDNEFDRLDDLEELKEQFRRIESPCGLYACYGNHDIDEPVLGGFSVRPDGPEKKMSDPRMDAFLEEVGITLLTDEGVFIDNSFYLYGRPDRQNPGRGLEVRRTPAEVTAGMDLSYPVIVLDHQPAQLEELAAAGVDLDLSGHTHDGQIFPLNIATRLMWENSYGYLRVGDMHSVVTAGVGLYGPYMRVGTKPDISVITLRFAQG